MGEKIRFSKNYHDLSTDTGYQFEFFCDHCGNGYRSTFQGSFSGKASQFLNVASTLFGGVLSSVSNAGNKVRDAGWEGAHDKAFLQAIEELTPNFIHCPHCMKWVCREDCWNLKKGLCKDCAPDLGVEMAKAQSDRSVEEIHAHAAMAEEDKKLDTAQWRQNIMASCPKCEAPLTTNAKFCPECGARIRAEDKCAKCGAKLTQNAKFCFECGEKI